jgi:hypothetical protein
VSFAKKPRPFDSPDSRRRLERIPATRVARTILLAAIVAIAAAWALVRHYSQTLPPMRVPVSPTAAPTYDIDAGEMPVPEILEPDAG